MKRYNLFRIICKSVDKFTFYIESGLDLFYFIRLFKNKVNKGNHVC